jgi:mannose-6-phosphate isomerase-like protein (cupin superfamily)
MAMRNDKHSKSAWVTEWTKEEKPWGHEMVWPSFSAGHGKMLKLLDGKRTSLKYNPQKNEALIVLSGTVEACFGDEHTIEDPGGHPWTTFTLTTGMTLNVQSGCPYRLTALEDSVIIEIGDHLTDKPVRIEDDYGRK